MDSERILVTGASGFVGRRVCQRWPHALAWPRVDLRCREQVEAAVHDLLGSRTFGCVLHLAGVSSVWESYSDPVPRYEINTMGTVHLLHALTRAGWRGRFLYVSTTAVYGEGGTGESWREDSPLAPASPYAASKAAAELAVLEWGRRSGGQALVARPTNHTGGGQSAHFFLPSMASQITAVPRPEKVLIETGNLSAYRDFLHVDDVIDAYGSLLEKGRSGQVYNVARGASSTMASLLDGLIAASGRQVEARVRPERFRQEASRPLEIAPDRLCSHTGWRPLRGLEQIYADLIAFWEAEHEKKSVDHGGLGAGRSLS
jgi:GDP-4-dehydro-6-deoxy-D-mannose reductase